MKSLTNAYTNSNKKNIVQMINAMKTWLQIAAPPFFAGMIIGLLIYTQYSGRTTLFIALCTSITGLVLGVSWATRICSKERTLQFFSRIIMINESDEESRSSHKQ